MVLNAAQVAYGAVCARTCAPLLCLSTARDAVGARQVGCAQVKVNRKVSSLVTRPEAKLCVVEHGTAMSIDSPFIRTLGHDEEPRAITTCVVQTAEAPQERGDRDRDRERHLKQNVQRVSANN